MKAYEIIILFLVLLIICVAIIATEQKVLDSRMDADSKIEKEKRKGGLVSDCNTRLTGMKSNFSWEDGSSDSGIHNKIERRLEEKMKR